MGFVLSCGLSARHGEVSQGRLNEFRIWRLRQRKLRPMQMSRASYVNMSVTLNIPHKRSKRWQLSDEWFSRSSYSRSSPRSHKHIPPSVQTFASPVRREWVWCLSRHSRPVGWSLLQPDLKLFVTPDRRGGSTATVPTILFRPISWTFSTSHLQTTWFSPPSLGYRSSPASHLTPTRMRLSPTLTPRLWRWVLTCGNFRLRYEATHIGKPSLKFPDHNSSARRFCESQYQTGNAEPPGSFVVYKYVVKTSLFRYSI